MSSCTVIILLLYLDRPYNKSWKALRKTSRSFKWYDFLSVFGFPNFVRRILMRKTERALKFHLVRISDDNDQNFVFYRFRSNLPLFCYNVHYQWRVDVMYPSYWLPFMCQILSLYFICFTDSLRMLIIRKAFRKRRIKIQNPDLHQPFMCWHNMSSTHSSYRYTR